MRATRLLTAVVAGFALAGCGGSPPAGSPPATQSPTASVTSGPTASSPQVAGPQVGVPTDWKPPADASAAAKAAGLPMLGEEKLAVHYHAHLDVLVNGQHVPVPAGLGIDQARRLIAPLHTHDGSGVVHIESATDVPFTLGQVFTEWGQPLRADQVGPVKLSAGQVLRVFRNGKPVTGDPAALATFTPPAARQRVDLDAGWRFLRADATGAQNPGFDDSAWAAVTVPHTWNARDGEDGGDNYYRGVGWYRRHYTPPASFAGRKLWLQFAGANTVTDVWV